MNNPVLADSPPDHSRVLLAACLAGDTSAYRGIVTQHQALVVALCYAALGSRQAAEEAAQEVFVVGWRQLASLRDPDKLRPWLAGIARHVCANARRARQRDLPSLPEATDETPDPAGGPDVAAVAREEELIVDRALAGLPEEYRETLVLFYREGQSARAVAGALEISEDAVRQRLVRGRRLLQERVLAQVERTLQRTGPGAAFAVAVLALLPAPAAPAAVTGAVALPLATSAVLGTTGASLGVQLGWLGAGIGFACGALGGWLGSRHAFAQARTPAQQRTLASAAWSIGLLALVYVTALSAFIWNLRRLAALHPALPWSGILLLLAGYLIALFSLIVRSNRRFRQVG